MSLSKQPISINFSQGLELKTDPFQTPIGKFSVLKNSVFQKGGLLQKRNGFGNLTTLPDNTSRLLCTFNEGLTAVGDRLRAYSTGTKTWSDKGPRQPVSLNTLPLVRSSTNQSQCDSIIAPNGLICTVFTDNVPVAGTNQPVYKYVIADRSTGQNVIPPSVIPITAGAVNGSPRIFLLGQYFVIVFSNLVAGVNHLQYVAVSVNDPTQVISGTDISTQYAPHSTVAFDGIVANNKLYLAWNGNDGGGAIRLTSLNNQLGQSNTVVFAGKVATIMSLEADISGSSPVIYCAFYNSGSSTGFILAVDQNLLTILSPTSIVASGTINNITLTAQNAVATVFYEVDNNYAHPAAAKSNYIASKTVTQSGVVSGSTVVARSVGLASEAFLLDGVSYMLTTYGSSMQPTYFLIRDNGNVIAKLAYSNGGGYLTLGLPSVTLIGSTAYISYLIKDLVAAVTKDETVTNTNPIYSQTGINLATFEIGMSTNTTAEIGSDLYLTGGFLWMYDGYTPVEHLFHVWPDDLDVTTATTGGHLADQQYFYVATYEWADNQGNVFRSAPSVPLAITTTGGNVSANTIYVPTLRLTYKTANPVKIVIYRWSTAQQVYHQVTSILTPVLNDTSVDSVSWVDTLSDDSIQGNNILYTTGGVLENIAAPAIETMTLWQSRLVMLDAEDRNLLWISKQVIETVPVETSDLLTLYVAPTIGSQGPTGPVKTLATMDEKLIVFKANAIYYFNGQGPDNTGANSQIGDPIFITATVGCANQNSIVFTPNGLLFQSDKGIWLLGRDLSTTYLGAPVESFTQNSTVLSAVSIPGTNQVRFTMDSGITLMYDYFYGQWGTFVNIPAISSTLFEGLHTYVDTTGIVRQETPGRYLDGSNPVLMGFTTSWLNPSGLQGFQRVYDMFILGTYISPHKLEIQIAYDYNQSPEQSTVLSPDNFTQPWGGEQLWGSAGPWGGPGNIEQWRIFFNKQKCESFQVSINELFDPSYGTVAGAGLTMSGMNLTVGLKDSKPRLRGSRQAG